MENGQTTNELRLCSVCREWKPTGEFHRRGEGYQRWCKACRRPYDAAYYTETRDLRLIQRHERYRRLLEWMRELKGSRPCVDCGGRFHPAAMTFDHLPGTPKRDDISTLLHQGRANQVRDEILKCDLVCANCHAVRTFLRQQEARAASVQQPPSIAETPAANWRYAL